ncbi:hypothetical protein D3C76_1319110 [compost metagenome]
MRNLVDALGGGGELTANSPVTDYLGVGLGVGHARRIRLDLAGIGQRPCATGKFGTAIAQGNHVDRLAIGMQLKNQPVQVGVVVPSKCLGREGVGQNIDQVRLAKHGANYAVLGLKAVKFVHCAASEISRNTARLTKASSRGWTF